MMDRMKPFRAIRFGHHYARFVPGQKKITIEEVYNKMQTWRQEIPAELEWTDDPSHTRLLATCLSILHDQHLMLAGLGRDGEHNAFNGWEVATSGHDLGQAALRISNASSGIVTRSQALCAPHETYQGIFLAGIVSYVEMRSGHATLAQLGQLVVSNCQMVLHHVREAWDPSPWVLALFEKLTCSIGTDSQHGIDVRNSITDPSRGQAPFDFGSFSGIDEPFVRSSQGSKPAALSSLEFRESTVFALQKLLLHRIWPGQGLPEAKEEIEVVHSLAPLFGVRGRYGQHDTGDGILFGDEKVYLLPVGETGNLVATSCGLGIDLLVLFENPRQVDVLFAVEGCQPLGQHVIVDVQEETDNLDEASVDVDRDGTVGLW
ncbi:hypothetical protein KC338_g8576 [Hortaea werneckii]|nr:hypothetical protein KC338_g8576 [Hortaea werneckii]